MIEIKDLQYKYKNSATSALEDINISISKGEFVAVIGQNGSGKSTLAKLIAGLDYPQKGKVLVNGIDTADKKKTLELRKTISIAFQNPENQLVFDRIYDDMEFTLKNLEIPDKRQRIEKALKKVNIKNLEYTYEISLGQKQRIVIASILAINPKYIVFDEPTAMLDPKGKKDVLNIIRKLNKSGITIIYVTNNIDEIIYADRVVVLEDKTIKKEFSKRELFDNIEILKKFNLELPFIFEIISKLKGKNIETDFLLEDYL